MYDKYKSPIFPFVLCILRRNFLFRKFRYKIEAQEKTLGSKSSYKSTDHAVIVLNFLLKVVKIRMSIACYLSEKLTFG